MIEIYKRNYLEHDSIFELLGTVYDSRLSTNVILVRKKEPCKRVLLKEPKQYLHKVRSKPRDTPNDLGRRARLESNPARPVYRIS